MQIVTDRAADMHPDHVAALQQEIYIVPLKLTLDGKDYVSGVDVTVENFYHLLEESEGMPVTTQPSPLEVENVYREIVEKTGDKEILSIHLSLGLSGTFNSARLAAEKVAADGITVHLYDTVTLSAELGWHALAAARAASAGWDIERIKAMLDQIKNVSDSLYTLPDLTYLIHGGRIGHMQGLVASTLGIKPIIGMSRETGKYDQRGRVRTFKKAIIGLAGEIEKRHPAGSKIRVQLMHALNLEATDQLRAAIDAKFEAEYLPTIPIAPVLGAHTGVGLVGCAYAPADRYPQVP